MRRHIEVLGLLHVVGGLLSVASAVSLLLLGAGAASMWLAGTSSGPPLAAAVVASAFVTVAAVLGAWGLANALAGRALRRFSPRARLACLALAVLNMFLLPFGTALGIYALWVLMHEEARSLLGATSRSVAAGDVS